MFTETPEKKDNIKNTLLKKTGVWGLDVKSLSFSHPQTPPFTIKRRKRKPNRLWYCWREEKERFHSRKTKGN